jgi:hypothetical protein
MYTTSQFTWSGRDATCFLTDLVGANGTAHKQIHEDSAVNGFSVKSDKTERILLFVFTEPIHAPDGEFVGWKYKCAAAAPEYKSGEITITIYNT